MRAVPSTTVQRETLVLGVAAVLAGVAVAMATLAVVYQPFLFAVAVPFGVAAYLMWHEATGRTAAWFRRRRARRAGPGNAARGPDWEGVDPRASDGFDPREGYRRPPREPGAGPSEREAYERLGLEPGADEAAVTRAYRRQVKEVHPDAEDGDEEAFKELTRAYETLTE